MKIPWPPLRPRFLYAGATALAFLLAMRCTFPSEAVKERLIYEAGKAGWQVDVVSVRPGGVLGVRLDGVALTDPSGLKIPVERLDASLRFWRLLIGRRTVAYTASLYDGTVEGTADLSGATRRLQLQVEGVNLAQVLPLRKAVGFDLTGVLSGSADLSYPAPTPEQAAGKLDLTVQKGGLAGSASLPPVALGPLHLAATAKEGLISLTTLESRGGDVELTGEELKVVLQKKMAYSPLSGRARLRIQQSLWAKPAAATLKPVVEMALTPAKSPDGSYQYQVFGTLSRPSLVPMSAPQ